MAHAVLDIVYHATEERTMDVIQLPAVQYGDQLYDLASTVVQAIYVNKIPQGPLALKALKILFKFSDTTAGQVKLLSSLHGEAVGFLMEMFRYFF